MRIDRDNVQNSVRELLPHVATYQELLVQDIDKQATQIEKSIENSEARPKWLAITHRAVAISLFLSARKRREQIYPDFLHVLESEVVGRLRRLLVVQGSNDVEFVSSALDYLSSDGQVNFDAIHDLELNECPDKMSFAALVHSGLSVELERLGALN